MSSLKQDRLPHREALLRQGVKQFFVYGYHGTTVDGLLEASGVPKGSFYHHFGTKEAFAAVVIQRYGQFHRETLDGWVSRTELSTSDKLAGYVRQLANNFISSGYIYSNLVGKLATEVATSSPALREEIRTMMSAWRSDIVPVLEDGQRSGDVRRDRTAADLAAAINAVIDGTFLVAQSTHDDALFDSAIAAVRRIIEPSR